MPAWNIVRNIVWPACSGAHAGDQSDTEVAELSRTALAFLSARLPLPEVVTDLICAGHAGEQGTDTRWDDLLDIGCGVGQSGIQLSHHFRRVHGVDSSEEMVVLAKVLLQVDPASLALVGLPAPAKGTRIDYHLGTGCSVKMGKDSVDLLTCIAAAHLFDWSSRESSARLWREWTRVVRKGGTLVLSSGPVPVAGDWTDDNSAAKTRPLRQMLRNLALEGPLSSYYTRQQAEVGSGTMYQALPMPWQVLDGMDDAWDSSSRLFLLFGAPDDVTISGQTRLQSDSMPGWMPSSLRPFLTTATQRGRPMQSPDPKWRTITPRRLAQWLRSLSAYDSHLRQHPEERRLIGQERDLAARMIQEACREGHLAYDEPIELHQTISVLLLRRQR